MSSHVLDRPALHALRTRHARFAEYSGRALRYDPEVAPFIVAADESDQALADLGKLVPPGRISIMIEAQRERVPPGTVLEMAAEGVQMLAEVLIEPEILYPTVTLGDADVAEMVALAALTKPGPFLPKTHLFGGYIGIRDEGRLVAMAGERFKVPGFTEVSAVCTHPDFRGRGYAGFLTWAVASGVAARGETPFLHTFASNAAAIRIYEKLGFTIRRTMAVSILSRA